jgi:aryl-alcohol dehydrogenase-like predicted oxidoreductase
MGPLQADKTIDEMVEIISKAIDYGVNFFDTAEMYQTQCALGEAMQGRRSEVIISTKSQAATYDDMARSFEKSLREAKD